MEGSLLLANNQTFINDDDDKLFLANFIVANYLGPDVLSDIPRRSVAHRLSRRSPPYTSNHLGDSSVTFSQLQNLYYYALRHAHPTRIFTPTQLLAYLKGRRENDNYHTTPTTTNFTTFFPPHLHKHKFYSSSKHEVVKGVVVIHDYDPTIVDNELNRSSIDRFRQLSGSVDLKMDATLCLTYRHRPEIDDDDDERPGPPLVLFQGRYKRRRVISDGDEDGDESYSCPTAEEIAASEANATVIVNDKTVTFKLVGLSSDFVVIGISRSAYLFRIALPGGLHNNFRGLSCEVWSDGKVEISQKQEIGADSSALSGGGLPPFSLSFYLPGPVDPRLFAPNLRSDGVLEAVVVKKLRG